MRSSTNSAASSTDTNTRGRPNALFDDLAPVVQRLHAPAKRADGAGAHVGFGLEHRALDVADSRVRGVVGVVGVTLQARHHEVSLFDGHGGQPARPVLRGVRLLDEHGVRDRQVVQVLAPPVHLAPDVGFGPVGLGHHAQALE